MSTQYVCPEPTICILEGDYAPQYMVWTDKHGQVHVDSAESDPNAFKTYLARLRSIEAAFAILEAPC